MTSIPVGTCRISHNNLKRSDLRKKNFFIIFISFLKYALDWEHFEKKDEYPSLVISKIIDSARGGYLIV